MSSDLPRPFPDVSGKTEIFDEFFDSGMEESISPFLTPSSRHWGRNLSLKSSFIAAALLFLSFFLSFFSNTKETSYLLLLFTYFFAGIPALISSIEDIFNFEINIDVLMTLAAFLSIIIGSGVEGALLLVLFSFSGAMEEAVTSKAKGAIQAIKRVAPTKAYVLGEDGRLIERSVRDIKVDTLIFIKSGEIVPLDGKVVEGSSSVNLVHLTGENIPVLKNLGDEVASGARNLEGALTLKVTRTSSDSTIAQIIKLITQAQRAKPKIQRWLDKISGRYAITIISLSFIFALTFPLIFAMPYLGKQGSIYRALSFLIAASPCALIIAIPIAYLSAVSVCARKGILLKGGIILDALASCKLIALDKTGTITEGELSLIGMEDLSGKGNLDEALQVAYSLERHVIHPIAIAIVKQGEEKKLQPLPLSAFKASPGFGLQALYKEKEVYIGHKDFILSKVDPSKKEIIEKKLENSAYAYTLLYFDQGIYLFRFEDKLRSEVRKTFAALKKKWKMRLLMLTGDHFRSAERIAKEAGIDEFYADLTPEQKLKKIEELAQNNHLAMVGDGVNDAPSLARATVGISMGKKGSATAVDASDIVLLHDNIEHLEWLMGKAHATKKIVGQNLVFALFAIIVAVFPALLGWIPLWVAVVLHEGGTVIVGLNALRLLRK